MKTTRRAVTIETNRTRKYAVKPVLVLCAIAGMIMLPVFLLTSGREMKERQPTLRPTVERASINYGQLPLSFEANSGQAN